MDDRLTTVQLTGFVGVRKPVAVAGPGFPVVCVLFACAELHVVCVFVRSSMLSVCLSGVLTLVQKLPIVSLSCSSTLHHHFTSCASGFAQDDFPSENPFLAAAFTRCVMPAIV